jgi:hypothetical protein
VGNIFVDTRLIDLASGMLHDPEYPLDLARIQAGNSEIRGHLLALNDEFVWRRLKTRREPVAQSRLRVRCMACGAVASLREWFVACTMGEDHAADLQWRLSAVHPSESLAWLLPCSGERKAQGLISGLAVEADQYRKEVARHAASQR